MTDDTTRIYLRVSSKTQDTRSQEPDLKRWAEANGVDYPAAVRRDRFTGRTMSRPGWESIWSDVLAGRVARVVVWRLDRLGRTTAGLAHLFDELVGRKVTLVSLRDGFDLLTSSGRLHARIIASVAEYEREVRQERQLAGIAAAKEAGKTWGGNTNGGKRIKVTDEQLDQVKRLKAEGAKVAAIARATGLSRPTVYSILGERGATG